jgi:hypothetical protein
MNKEEARKGLIAAIDNECVNNRILAECLSTWRGHGRPPGLTLIEAQLEMAVNRTASAIDDFEVACREGIRSGIVGWPEEIPWDVMTPGHVGEEDPDEP